MKKTSSPSGKILTHATGTGLMTRKDLKTRAQEIAQINRHAAPTKNDREEAEQDLRGDTVPPTSEKDSNSARGLTRDPSEPVSNYGSAKPTEETDDTQNASERMVLEGVEEAEHDQMLAARRQHK